DLHRSRLSPRAVADPHRDRDVAGHPFPIPVVREDVGWLPGSALHPLHRHGPDDDLHRDAHWPGLPRPPRAQLAAHGLRGHVTESLCPGFHHRPGHDRRRGWPVDRPELSHPGRPGTLAAGARRTDRTDPEDRAELDEAPYGTS